MTADILGVDFSGARAAGDALWVTEATHTPAGLRVEDCYRATDRWGRDRADAHAGLVSRVTAGGVDTVGLDFPFSLPTSLLEARCGGDWRGFLSWVGGDDGPADPAAFSEACRTSADAIAGTRDIRRETDARRGALCPYTNRVRSMSYHGARDVLAPLADREDTAVVPMQDGAGAATTVCEVYPAATFGWLGAYREGYKNTDGARARREHNVAAVEDCSVIMDDHRETFLENHDALDSLAAAVSAARVDDGAGPTPAATREEGCIYV